MTTIHPFWRRFQPEVSLDEKDTKEEAGRHKDAQGRRKNVQATIWRRFRKINQTWSFFIIGETKVLTKKNSQEGGNTNIELTTRKGGFEIITTLVRQKFMIITVFLTELTILSIKVQLFV